MILDATCHISFSATAAIPAIMMLRPRSGYAQWITPAVVKTRFDTHFFLAELPEGQDPRVDGEECIDAGWFTPQGALDEHAAGRLELVFPTIKHLEQFAGFESMRALLDHAASAPIHPVLPKVFMAGEEARILLPGEAGYEDA